MQIPQIYFVFNCAHAVSNTWTWGSWDLLFFPLLCIHKDSSSEEERLTPSFFLLKELSEKWTPFFYLPGSNETFSESKKNVFRKCTYLKKKKKGKCTYLTVGIQFPGVHGAPETHSWTPASELLSLLMFSTLEQRLANCRAQGKASSRPVLCIKSYWDTAVHLHIICCDM